MPEVSIVLPTYNGEQYIRQSIESILKQTFQDWELIIVNDCSTDRTIEIINQYSKSDERIKILNNNENKKLPSSLNIGFEYSVGRFLTWTSDDNLYCENALEIMKNELEVNPGVSMVHAEMINIDENGRKLGLQKFGKSDMIYFYNNIGACFLYRRSVLDKIGGYDENLFLVEDYDYWLRIFECDGKIKRIYEPLYYYRRHKNSLSETKKILINNQIKKLKNKHILILLNILKRNPSMVCQLYLNYFKYIDDINQINKCFFDILPELKYNNYKLRKNRVVILGAGNTGSHALQILNKKVISFSDNDTNKIGKYKNGLPIISFQEMLKIKKDVDVVIAVSPSSVYEILLQLIAARVNEFYIFQCMFNDFIER